MGKFYNFQAPTLKTIQRTPLLAYKCEPTEPKSS